MAPARAPTPMLRNSAAYLWSYALAGRAPQHQDEQENQSIPHFILLGAPERRRHITSRQCGAFNQTRESLFISICTRYSRDRSAMGGGTETPRRRRLTPRADAAATLTAGGRAFRGPPGVTVCATLRAPALLLLEHDAARHLPAGQ